MTQTTNCRAANDLALLVEAARDPGSATLLEGLTEKGLVNRAHQLDERIRQAEFVLNKHKKSCPICNAARDPEPAQ